MVQEGRKSDFLGNPDFFEVCINVPDLEKSLEQFKTLFKMTPYLVRETKIRNIELHGEKKPDARIKFAYFRAGPMRLELLQPLEGESIWAEYVQKKGTGIQHIGCRVSDLDSELAELQKRGVRVSMFMGEPRVNMKIAYLDTDDLLGTSLELIQFSDPPEEFLVPPKEEELKFLEEPHFFEVCVVVSDLENSLERMKSLFDMTPYLVQPVKAKGIITLHGQKVPEARFTYAYFHAGPMRLELLQPEEGESIYREFLDRKGVCIQHIGCRTNNIDSELAHLEEVGVGATQLIEVPRANVKIVNTNTDSIAGVEFELIQSEGIPGE